MEFLKLINLARLREKRAVSEPENTADRARRMSKSMSSAAIVEPVSMVLERVGASVIFSFVVIRFY